MVEVSKIGVKKRMGLELASLYHQNLTRLHPLQTLFWECTLRCNIHCLHCGSDCTSVANIKDMPAEDFLRTLDSISPHVETEKTMIILSGGEPLMRKDLETVGSELYKRRYPWGIVTNGYALTPARLQSLLEAGMRALTMSLDGFEKEHNQLRGNPTLFNKAIGILPHLVNAPDLIWDLVTCVSPLNIDYLDEFKEFLIQQGVKRWRIFAIFPSGRAKDNPLLKLDNKQFKTMFDFIVRTRREGRINLSYGCEGFLGGYENEVRDGFFFCRAGITVASILADGTISGCPSIRSGFGQGNIYQDHFMEVWNHRFQPYRNRSWTQKGACADCSYYRYCKGNGLHLYDNNRELSFCHYQRLNP